MKCPHCGSPIGLEDHYCTFCGAKNTLAQEHQQDMTHYKREFKKTQSEVLNSSKNLKRFFSSFFIISVLVVMVFVSHAFCTSTWQIGSFINKRKISAHHDEHLQNLKQLMKDEDYLGFYHYYNSYSLYFSDDFRSFHAVNDAASSYYYIVRFIMNITDDPNYLDNILTDSTINSISSNFNSIYNEENTYHYDQESYYSEENLEFIHGVQNEASLLLTTYFHLTKEEAESFPNLSLKAQTDLLERSLLNS